ncbi:hypothetical protein D3C79_371340 [compost metagenome]
MDVAAVDDHTVLLAAPLAVEVQVQVEGAGPGGLDAPADLVTLAGKRTGEAVGRHFQLVLGALDHVQLAVPGTEFGGAERTVAGRQLTLGLCHLHPDGLGALRETVIGAEGQLILAGLREPGAGRGLIAVAEPGLEGPGAAPAHLDLRCGQIVVTPADAQQDALIHRGGQILARLDYRWQVFLGVLDRDDVGGPGHPRLVLGTDPVVVGLAQLERAVVIAKQAHLARIPFVDAVRDILADQGPRALGGGGTLDVIGTSHRRPHPVDSKRRVGITQQRGIRYRQGRGFVQARHLGRGPSYQVDHVHLLVGLALHRETGQVVAVVTGVLLVPVEAAVVAMTTETPDEAPHRLGTVHLGVDDGLHDVVQLLVIEQAEFPHQIDLLAGDGTQILLHLIRVIVAGVGVVVVADDVDVRILEREVVDLLVGAIDDQLVRGEPLDPDRGLGQEGLVGVLQLVACLPGHDCLLVIVVTTGDGVLPGDHLADDVLIGLVGLARGLVEVIGRLLVEGRQLLASPPPPPVIDERQDEPQPLLVGLGNHVVIDHHGLLVEHGHAIRTGRRQDVGLTFTGLIVLLLHREDIDPLGLGAGLHHGADPVGLLLGGRPLEVLTPAARVGLAHAARIILDAV